MHTGPGEECQGMTSRHIEWSTHRGAKGLVRVNDLINKYADDNVISVRLRIRGSPRRAFLLMLRRLESQCTGGARESEEVKVKGGREGGREGGRRKGGRKGGGREGGSEGVGEIGEKERKEERGIRAKKDGTRTK